jgi:hypothetical protein
LEMADLIASSANIEQCTVKVGVSKPHYRVLETLVGNESQRDALLGVERARGKVIHTFDRRQT